MIDLKLTYQGNFIVEAGDLALISGEDWMLRTIGLRLRTPSTCTLWPGVGLTRFSGKPGNSMTYADIASTIKFALTKDGFMPDAVVSVQPGSRKDEVAIDITGNGGNVSMNVFSLDSGILASINEPEATTEVYQTATSVTRTNANKYLARNPK